MFKTCQSGHDLNRRNSKSVVERHFFSCPLAVFPIETAPPPTSRLNCRPNPIKSPSMERSRSKGVASMKNSNKLLFISNHDDDDDDDCDDDWYRKLRLFTDASFILAFRKLESFRTTKIVFFVPGFFRQINSQNDSSRSVERRRVKILSYFLLVLLFRFTDCWYRKFLCREKRWDRILKKARSDESYQENINVVQENFVKRIFRLNKKTEGKQRLKIKENEKIFRIIKNNNFAMPSANRPNEIMMIIIIAATLSNVCYSIQNVKLILPPFVQTDTIATLLCLYDLEGASLYSVQWYRGRFEFFRFVPNEIPQKKSFRVPGILVDIFASNAHQVTLRNVPFQISGEFSCEITTDFPRFRTSRASKNLTVVGLELNVKTPERNLHFGDFVEANCTLTPQLPMIKLKFYWDVTPVPDQFISSDLPNSIALVLNSSKFVVKKEIPISVRLTCSAILGNAYYVISKSSSFHLQPSKRPEKLSSAGTLKNQRLKNILFDALIILNVIMNLIT